MAKNTEGKLSKYTGLIIAALTSPVYLLFVYLDQPDIGLTAVYCLGTILLAIRVRWDLRKHAWFWVVMAVVLALHVPLIVSWRWPDRWIPGIALLPFAAADCAMILGVVRVGERLAGAKGGEGDTLEDEGDSVK
jgi:multisubunit Na+/H+ antiporter MnhB subunit